MKLTNTRLTRIGFAVACLGCLTAGLRAQTTTPATTTTTTTTTTTAPADDQVTTLEKYTVSDVPLQDQVLPTVRPIGDVMGEDMNIIDIPRSLSAVNPAMMADRMVKNAMDFGQFAPGVYSAAEYGIPAIPFIRGDLAQIYVGGQAISFSRNSTPPSFNGVDAMDIVKGPGSAVYGPQGEGAGGYVDFVMKQPYFDAEHADIDLTLGYWSDGRTYSNPDLTIDFGGPLSDKLAYRISYLSRYGDGYYLNDHNQTQDVYAALTWLPTSKLKIEGWTEAYSDRINEIAGVSRVTQDFIWNGNYIAGPSGPTTSGPTAYFGYDIIAAPNPPPGTYGSYTDGSYAVVNPATAHTVKLPIYDALISPSDTARSFLFQTQIKETLDLTPDSTLVNRTYYSFNRSEKKEEVGYSEYVPRSVSLQDRLEYHDKFTIANMDHSLITGVDFRYTGMTSYQDYQTEPVNTYDLTQPLSQIAYPGYALEGNTWGGGLQVPGTSGYSASPGNISNSISSLYDTAAFVQDDVKVFKNLSVIPGYRWDNLDAYGESPPFVEEGYYNSSFSYVPLATPLYIPAGGSGPGVTGYNTHLDANDQSYFISVTYKLTPASTIYATYDHVDAVLGSSNFGGIDPLYLGQTLHTKSTLYEIGYKQSFLNNTLYFSSSLFQQLKYGAQMTGGVNPIKNQGLELDSSYQPNKRWTFNANFTYNDSTTFGGYFYQSTGNYLDAFATTTPVDGTYGTGIGAPNFTGYVPPAGRMRSPGVPQVMANGFVEYRDPLGWGIGAGPQFVGRMEANDQDTLHIPGECEFDGYIFYGQRSWEVRINVKNFTNARLVDPIDVSYAGNSLIYVRPPITASVTLRYRY
jgi:hypothetical protein